MPCAGISGTRSSLRDVEELLAELDLEADYTTIWPWVQRYGPELEQRLRRDLKPTNNPGALMRHVFESRAVNVTSTGSSIRAIKRPMKAKKDFREFRAAERTIEG